MSKTDQLVKNFVFNVVEDRKNSEDITYTIGIGDKSFSSLITLWSYSFSRIRERFEEYLRDGHTVIELDYDMEITRISLNREGINVNVEIVPNYWVDKKQTSLSGMCQEKDVLSKLYNGLLYATTFLYDDMGYGWNWFYCKMVNYNMMKSHILEHFLIKSEYLDIDHFVVKHVLVYNGKDILHICDEAIGYHIPISDQIHVLDKTGSHITCINGNKLRNGDYYSIAAELPTDFDLWVFPNDSASSVTPKLIGRTKPIGYGEVFYDEKPKMENLGDDPYGFTSETIRSACDELDFDKIKFFLSLGVDWSNIIDWIICSNDGGTCDEVGNPTFEETEESLRKRDRRKSEILQYVLDTCKGIELTEDHLSLCCWYYSPVTMNLLLKSGANPNERKFIDYWQSIKVKYRSVLNSVILGIKEGKDKYGMLSEMKSYLEKYGAEDVVIWNDE